MSIENGCDYYYSCDDCAKADCLVNKQKKENARLQAVNDRLLEQLRLCEDANEVIKQNAAELQKRINDLNKTLDLWQDDIHYLRCDKAELQTQIEQLRDEKWKAQDDLDNYHETNRELEKRNAELQKQVDALKTENKELYKEHTTLIAGSILKQQDIVKDTAKEIFTEILRRMKKLKDMFESPFGDYRESKEHLVATIEIEIEGIKNLAKQYGVEVE